MQYRREDVAGNSTIIDGKWVETIRTITPIFVTLDKVPNSNEVAMTVKEWNAFGFRNDAVVEILFHKVPDGAHPLDDGYVSVTLNGAAVVEINNESYIHIRKRSGIEPYQP